MEVEKAIMKLGAVSRAPARQRAAHPGVVEEAATMLAKPGQRPLSAKEWVEMRFMNPALGGIGNGEERGAALEETCSSKDW
jgi:hypothetical protein